MTLDQATDMSWEQLTALAEAYRKRDAEWMLQFMCAAQGDAKSWSAQQKMLLKILKH